MSVDKDYNLSGPGQPDTNETAPAYYPFKLKQKAQSQNRKRFFGERPDLISPHMSLRTLQTNGQTDTQPNVLKSPLNPKI